MKLFRILCFLCLPVLVLHPVPIFSQTTSCKEESKQALFIPRDSSGLINPKEYFDIQNMFTHPRGYIDNCFQFIELLCQEEFIEELSEVERNRALDFAIGLVLFSIPKNRPDLKERCDQEIETLLNQLATEEEALAFSFGEEFEFSMDRAVCYSQSEFLLCKSWLKRKWGHFSHWCDKHKKELIAGTAVVAIVGITIATGGVGGSAAAAVGGALVGAVSEDTPTHINKPGEVFFVDELPQALTPSPPQLSGMPPTFATVPQSFYSEEASSKVVQETETAKEIFASSSLEEPLNASEETFWNQVKEETKETASHIAHEIFESAAQVGEYYHQLNPSSGPDDLQAYRESVETTHQVIDQVFHTDQAENYAQESKEAVAQFKDASNLSEMQTGTPPPPGSLVGVIGRAISAARAAGVVSAAAVGSAVTQPSGSSVGSREIPLDQFAEAGKEPDRGDLTMAGRSLAKHGGRPDSVFPNPTGGPAQINEQGQAILEGILNDPNKSVTQSPNGNIKVYNKCGQGAHFTSDGKFIGFIEAQYE